MTYEHRPDTERSPYAVQLDDLSLDAWDDDRTLESAQANLADVGGSGDSPAPSRAPDEHERAQAQRRGSEPGQADGYRRPASSPGAPAVAPALGVRSTDNTQGEQHEHA